MEEVFKYLKALDVNFLATRNGAGVSCRPFCDPVKFNGKMYMLTHAEKNVAKQLAENNQICIVAYNPEKDDWLRVFVKPLTIATIPPPSKPSSTSSTGQRKPAIRSIILTLSAIISRMPKPKSAIAREGY